MTVSTYPGRASPGVTLPKIVLHAAAVALTFGLVSLAALKLGFDPDAVRASQPPGIPDGGDNPLTLIALACLALSITASFALSWHRRSQHAAPSTIGWFAEAVALGGLAVLLSTLAIAAYLDHALIGAGIDPGGFLAMVRAQTRRVVAFQLGAGLAVSIAAAVVWSLFRHRHADR